MPGLEWLIINEGKSKGNPPKCQEIPHNFWLAGGCQGGFKGAVHSVKLATVKLQKKG